MQNILIIGGTRNMGYELAVRLNDAGHRVTVLNRGISPDELPDNIFRLRADRTDMLQLRRALLAKSFDAVVDFVLYNGQEAQASVEVLNGMVGQYLFISSGQVYLVREDISRPFREDQYTGRLIPAPKENTYAYEEWHYGMGKREAEDVLFASARDKNFPFTTFRLPMVNSERDQQRRLYSYILRLRDGNPLLIPETPNHPLRHIDGLDVVRLVQEQIERREAKRDAINLAQDETLSIDEFLELLARLLGTRATLVRAKTSELEAAGFMPHCSPFSDRWMSEITNERSKTELSARYTPLEQTLERLVAYYLQSPPSIPIGYKRRQAEVNFARQLSAT